MESCPICKKYFAPNKPICGKQHITLYHKLKKKVLMCECGHASSVKAVFMSHLKANHPQEDQEPHNYVATLELPFRTLRHCSICNYRTVSYNTLLNHEFSVHGLKMNRKGITANGMQPRSLLQTTAEVVSRSLYGELTAADVPRTLLKVIKDSCK